MHKLIKMFEFKSKTPLEIDVNEYFAAINYNLDFLQNL